MTAPSMFRWTWEPPAAWIEELARVSPQQDRASHLVLQWESGTRTRPVQRWMLYESRPVLPGSWTAQAVDVLRSEPIRTPGRARVMEHFQATGRVMTPFWVIQGQQGGHKYEFSEQDRQWCRWAGLPDDPPAPGALSFAPFDTRVTTRIMAYDRAQKAQATLANALDSERRDAEVELRRAMVHAFAENAYDAVTDTWSGLGYSDLPVADTPLDRVDEDRVDADYVLTGHLHTAR